MLCYLAAGAALTWLGAKQLPTGVLQEQVWDSPETKCQPGSGMNFGSMSGLELTGPISPRRCESSLHVNLFVTKGIAPEIVALLYLQLSLTTRLKNKPQ